jgi:transaldolase/glucose-6-phosphate isomerase
MGILNDLEKIGQSLWYDNIQRAMLQNGDIEGMILRGEIKGMTSNPSIFQSAITKSTDYTTQLQTLAWSGLSSEEIFWNLAIDDVQRAADLFLDTYSNSKKKDGYVSLEVNPNLAHDTSGTVNEAIELWRRVNRPNLMIKVPATREGIPAIKQLISNGINVNVTLIFSCDRYAQVIDAYISGLEDRVGKGESVDSIASVASFFVSRIDTKVDGYLGNHMKNQVSVTEKVIDLLGKAAIYNAKKAYQLFMREFKSGRFQKIKEHGGNPQRPLWASTSTKNPEYRDVMYIEELIGADTVNTVPPATLTAFLDHGVVAERITRELEPINEYFISLEKLGVFIDNVTEELEVEGVQAFSDSYNKLVDVIESRRVGVTQGLGLLGPEVIDRLKGLADTNFSSRLFDHDPALWTISSEGQKEIVQRLDWLEAPWKTEESLNQVEGLLSELKLEGFTHALILGMGGSSLAPEVFAAINGTDKFGLKVSILDSTHPEEVLAVEKRIPLDKTLFIVSSKSGTTAEINAFYSYFYEKMQKILGPQVGSHFLAITDPDTRLAKMATEKSFRRVIIANAKVGGRNSALTAFGLAPAALMGIDTAELVKNTLYNAKWFLPEYTVYENPGIVLGTIIGTAALNGVDKLTILADPDWVPFGAWMEQLIAESSGKEGKGILPIADEPLSSAANYQYDRLFVYLRKNGIHESFITELQEKGHPVISINVNNTYDLGYQFYLWEVATATACSILGVNSFDQPDVQDAKTRTLAGIEAFRKTGQFFIDTPVIKTPEFSVYSKQKIINLKAESPLVVIKEFLETYGEKNGYVALNAFVYRNDKNKQILSNLREWILEEFGMASTLGFGPRFLHSTGQLHKGGPENGIFIMITNTPSEDATIPGEGITFGNLCFAQALGDENALINRGRKVLRIHIHRQSIELL